MRSEWAACVLVSPAAGLLFCCASMHDVERTVTPQHVLQRCFRALLHLMSCAAVVQPLTAMQAHPVWCDALASQCAEPVHVASQERRPIQGARSRYMGRAWVSRGASMCGADVAQPEVDRRRATWIKSCALSPDLLVRGAFACDHKKWQHRVCFLLRLTVGDAARWPGVSLAQRHKGGPLVDVESWRLLFIRAQMGFLQEGILSDRLVGTIWDALSDGPSG